MNGDAAEQRETELIQTDMVVAGGGQQDSSFRPPTMSLNGEEHGPEKASKPVVKSQDHLSDDGEELCRICLMSGAKENPLYYPCGCNGSMKFTHEDCLLQWLNHRKNRCTHCEICKHAFAFQPVYAENTPSRLPLQELIPAMALKAARRLHFLTGLLIVLFMWLLLIPLTTAWMLRFTFVRSFSEAQKLLISPRTPSLLIMDYLYGISFLSVWVFGWAFGPVLALVSKVIWKLLREPQLQEDEHAEEGAQEDEHRELGEEVHDPVDIGALQAPLVVQPDGGNENLRPGQDPAEEPDHQFTLAEYMAARLDWVLWWILDVPVEELMRMNFTVFQLIKRAFPITVRIAIAVALVAFVPFALGRLALSVVYRRVFVTTTGTDMTPLNTVSLTRGNTSVGNASAVLPGSDLLLIGSAKCLASGVFGGVASGHNGYVGHNDGPEVMVAAFQLSNAVTVGLGYGFILLALGLGLGLRALLRYRQQEPSVTKQLMAGVKYAAITVVVAIEILIDVGVLILLYGWWLDICTLGVLNVSIAQRTEYFWASPFTSSLRHWLVGIVYIFHISSFIDQIPRKALHKGVLDSLQDLTYSNYNPFRILTNAPIPRHTRPVLFSVVLHGSLIVMLVFLPVQLAKFIAPSIFPLEIRVSDPLRKIWENITLYNWLCWAFLYYKVPTVIAKGLFHWLSISVGWALGLREFLREFLLRDLESKRNTNNQQERGPGVQEGLDHGPNINLAQAALDEPTVQAREPAESTFGQERLEDNFEREQNAEESKFVLQMVVLIGACVTIIAANSAVVVVTVPLGRWVLLRWDEAQVSKSDDITVIKTGFIFLLDALQTAYFVTWSITAAVRYIRPHDGNVVRMQVLKWSATVAKSSVLLPLGVFVIPVLIGLLFEFLVVVPIQVPIEKCAVPIFYVYQNWEFRWKLGSVLLTFWMVLVMLGDITPLANENWRLKFQHVWADGFANLRGYWVLKEIITPILARFLMAFCVPLAFARWMFPSLGYPLIVNSAVDRYAWLGFFGLVVLLYGIKRMQKWLSDFHNSIRNDRYLIGKKLHNLGENA